MLRILIEDSEGKSKLAPINPEAQDITIGRKEGNFIRLKERNVSRNHARIYQTPEGLFIEPVAARYGLKLNSSKIDGPTPLALGDEIRIGDYRLYIQDESKPSIKKEEDLNSVQDIPPEMQPRFVVISSNFAGREYHVMKTKVTIGRNPSSEICIEHQSVSSTHAEVRKNGRGDFEIRDLQSSNGTKVNGVPINEPWRLSSGDAVTLGHVTMRYCGPGDFWSLNFGINDEPKGSNKGLILAIGSDGLESCDKKSFEEAYAGVIQSVAHASPKTKIVCLSLCSVTSAYAGADGLSKDKAAEVNDWIKTVCIDTGAYYGELTDTLCLQGWLRADYADGSGRALNNAGLREFLNYLRDHSAADQ